MSGSLLDSRNATTTFTYNIKITENINKSSQNDQTYNQAMQPYEQTNKINYTEVMEILKLDNS